MLAVENTKLIYPTGPQSSQAQLAKLIKLLRPHDYKYVQRLGVDEFFIKLEP
jgi:hypothetical protein